MKHLLLSLMLALSSVVAFAQIDQPKEIQTSQKFGAYTVHYNLFNSKTLPPEISKAYNLTRSRDTIYINIAVTKTENANTSMGIPAKVTGKATNLIQQIKDIHFFEIKETDATYYLAPFRHTNEEDFRFEIQVIPEGETKPLVVSFTRRLFTEN